MTRHRSIEEQVRRLRRRTADLELDRLHLRAELRGANDQIAQLKRVNCAIVACLNSMSQDGVEHPAIDACYEVIARGDITTMEAPHHDSTDPDPGNSG